LNTNLLRDKDL